MDLAADGSGDRGNHEDGTQAVCIRTVCAKHEIGVRQHAEHGESEHGSAGRADVSGTVVPGSPAASGCDGPGGGEARQGVSDRARHAAVSSTLLGRCAAAAMRADRGVASVATPAGTMTEPEEHGESSGVRK
jgi:hypothetical protein